MFASLTDWGVFVGFHVFVGHGIVIEDCQSYVRHVLRSITRFGFHRSRLCLKDSAISLVDQHLSLGKS